MMYRMAPIAYFVRGIVAALELSMRGLRERSRRVGPLDEADSPVAIVLGARGTVGWNIRDCVERAAACMDG